jgi:hypothetical protein
MRRFLYGLCRIKGEPVCLYVYSATLLGNSWINTFPRQRRIFGGVVFYAVHVASKESVVNLWFILQRCKRLRLYGVRWYDVWSIMDLMGWKGAVSRIPTFVYRYCRELRNKPVRILFQPRIGPTASQKRKVVYAHCMDASAVSCLGCLFFRTTRQPWRHLNSALAAMSFISSSLTW